MASLQGSRCRRPFCFADPFAPRHQLPGLAPAALVYTARPLALGHYRLRGRTRYASALRRLAQFRVT